MNDRTTEENDPVAEDDMVTNEESDVTKLAEKRALRDERLRSTHLHG